MLATSGMVERTAFLSKEGLERWLIDSCTDTVLVSRAYAKRHNLKIDTAIRLRIGTAGGATFMTDDVVEFELMAKTLRGKMKPVKLRGHVADIGAECLSLRKAWARAGSTAPS